MLPLINIQLLTLTDLGGFPITFNPLLVRDRLRLSLAACSPSSTAALGVFVRQSYHLHSTLTIDTFLLPFLSMLLFSPLCPNTSAEGSPFCSLQVSQKLFVSDS